MYITSPSTLNEFFFICNILFDCNPVLMKQYFAINVMITIIIILIIIIVIIIIILIIIIIYNL